jgi:hypothetical protein
MCEDELGLVGEVEGDELAGLDAMLDEVLSVPTRLRVRLLPRIAARPRPNALLVVG